MYPPIPSMFRKAQDNYKIPNSKHVIPKDTLFLIPVIGYHYDERYWNDPTTFNPDRFTAEESANRPNFAFMPFGEGPMGCIGMR